MAVTMAEITKLRHLTSAGLMVCLIPKSDTPPFPPAITFLSGGS